MVKKKVFNELKNRYEKKYIECDRLRADNETYVDQVMALRNEVKRLGKMISANAGDCKVGVWCKDCKHHGHESATYKSYTSLYEDHQACWISNKTDGEVWFCRKHLNEICSEFEKEDK